MSVPIAVDNPLKPLFLPPEIAVAQGSADTNGTRGRSAPYKTLRVAIIYFWRHGRWPEIKNPTLFTELIQHRKLHDHDERFPALADKVAVKEFVATRLGAGWIVPTVWSGRQLPTNAAWPIPFVVKARHGCNQTRFVRSGLRDWESVRRISRRWVRARYGAWLDEWLYRHIPRGLLIEPFISQNADLPVDYKFFVFGGRVEFIQVHLDRATRHRWLVFDRVWRELSTRSGDAASCRPTALAEMIAAAETLGADFDFVRVDLYQVGDRPLFGEMTFYPGSGLYRLDPPWLDSVMGQYWRVAMSKRIRGLVEGSVSQR